MNKKSIENEAKRISNELLKKNNYNESFDDLINSLIKKNILITFLLFHIMLQKTCQVILKLYQLILLSIIITKISKNEIFFVFLGDFV